MGRTGFTYISNFTTYTLTILGLSLDTMRLVVCALVVALALLATGYQWSPVLSDSFPWRPCSPFEATKKNCPKGEPCMADLSYAGYVPNTALKCQKTRDRLLEQYHYE